MLIALPVESQVKYQNLASLQRINCGICFFQDFCQEGVDLLDVILVIRKDWGLCEIGQQNVIKVFQLRELVYII